MKTALVLLGMVLWPVMACAQLQTSVVEYTDKGTTLEGYVAEKTDLNGKRPGVLVVPDWMGVSEPYKKIADKLAGMGYVAFVVDIYGKGVRPANNQEAAVEATKYKTDRKLLRERVLAALTELRKIQTLTRIVLQPLAIVSVVLQFWSLPEAGPLF